MNSHYSDLLTTIKKCTIIPALSFYEDENLFINLEGKIQKTLKAINGPFHNINSYNCYLNLVFLRNVYFLCITDSSGT
jgi:NADH dehydrogenase/NADH:ubiquinone oxidoreductase subunit G